MSPSASGSSAATARRRGEHVPAMLTSSADFQSAGAANFGMPHPFVSSAGWKPCDTADWKSALRQPLSASSPAGMPELSVISIPNPVRQRVPLQIDSAPRTFAGLVPGLNAVKGRDWTLEFEPYPAEAFDPAVRQTVQNRVE